MAKQFEKKYMHPTRRKLVDMVMNGGEYAADTFISYTPTTNNTKREVGDIWTDANGITWEQHSYGKVQQSQLSETMAGVRNWLQKRNECKNKSCSKIKYGYTDKQLIRKTGFCSNCLAEKEFKIKLDGMWDTYERYKLAQNMIAHGRDVISQLTQSLNDVKDEYEIVNEDGTIERWKMEKNPDELRLEISETIANIEVEINDVITVRDSFWELLKDKNYELVTPPIS
jgi:hypothetical protein